MDRWYTEIEKFLTGNSEFLIVMLVLAVVVLVFSDNVSLASIGRLGALAIQFGLLFGLGWFAFVTLL